MKKTSKTFLLFAIGGMALSLLSLVIWISVNKNMDGFMFGRVVSVAPASLSIADRKEKITTVLVRPHTVISDKREKIVMPNIPVGQFVQVTGTRINPETIEADAIRFMRAPGPEKPLPHEAP